MSKPKRKTTGPTAWQKFSRDAVFYFAYPIDQPNTYKLIATGAYGVVQLRCIDNAVRNGFMAGYRAGRRASREPGKP